MNIVFISLLDFDSIDNQNIYTDLLREFVKNNHFLFIISPLEKRKNRASVVIKHENHWIIKPRIGNITKTSFLKKGFNTLFIEHQVSRYVTNKIIKKIDLILYTTPPITFVNFITRLKNKHQATTYLLLKDIFPQNAIDLGILKTNGIKGLIYRYFSRVEKRLYRMSDLIGCMSEGNVKYLLEHNKIAPSKVHVNPNSIDIYSKKYSGINKHKMLPSLGIPANKTILIYGGNLGKPQGIESVLEFLARMSFEEDFFIIVIGDGTESQKISRFIEQNHLLNSKYIPSLPSSEYEKIVSISDIGLVFLNSKFTIPNFPSRILTYMKYSLPILAVTDKVTDLKDVIINNKLGWWMASADCGKLEDIISDIRGSNTKQIGQKCYDYMTSHFNVEKSYEIILNQVNNNKVKNHTN